MKKLLNLLLVGALLSATSLFADDKSPSANDRLGDQTETECSAINGDLKTTKTEGEVVTEDTVNGDGSTKK